VQATEVETTCMAKTFTVTKAVLRALASEAGYSYPLIAIAIKLSVFGVAFS